MTFRRTLSSLLMVLVLVTGACGNDDETFESFNGEYQFGFPADRDGASLAAVAAKCGKGSGVASSRVDSNAADGSPIVVVTFENASVEDQSRVTACAAAEGSDSLLQP